MFPDVVHDIGGGRNDCSLLLLGGRQGHMAVADMGFSYGANYPRNFCQNIFILLTRKYACALQQENQTIHIIVR